MSTDSHTDELRKRARRQLVRASAVNAIVLGGFGYAAYASKSTAARAVLGTLAALSGVALVRTGPTTTNVDRLTQRYLSREAAQQAMTEGAPETQTHTAGGLQPPPGKGMAGASF